VSRRPSRGVGIRRKKGETEEQFAARVAARRQGGRIAVEDRSTELPCTRLSRAMEVLQAYDPERYLRVVELAEGYARSYGNPSEQECEAEHQARIARIRGQTSVVN
jgi:hypothetical protein